MANLSPKQTDEFKQKQYKSSSPVPGDEPLSKKPICVKYQAIVDERLRAMSASDRTALLRQLMWNWLQANS